MTDETLQQVDAFTTPGKMLRTARLEQEISEREAADRLNMMPGYVAIIERDDYEALRSPAFARGYVKAYGKMLGLDEEQLLEAFDQQRISERARKDQKRVTTRPLQLQSTGAGVVIGLTVLLLLIVVLWWWQGGTDGVARGQAGSPAEQEQQDSPESAVAGEP